jgi:glycosyltransferase involved in cell wall biosynthesis
VAGRPAAKRRLRGAAKQRIIDEVASLHELMWADSHVHFESLLQAIPVGYSLHRDAVEHPASWQMITEQNQRHNPVYGFADYFWAWKSNHDMIFNVLAAELPEADVYHAVSTGYAGLAAAAAKVRTGRPYVLTEHGLYHKEREMEIRRVDFIRGYQRDMWTKSYNRLSKISYQYADLIISLFEHNRQLQIELGAPAERCIVVPNGIDTEFYANAGREKRPGFHVGLVGRVVPIKDIKTFISMARIVADRVEDAVFHCIGPTDEDPAYYQDCRMLVDSLRLSDRFHFTGRADVRDYYRFLDVLLLTSVREAQPLVILEGYCADVPAVATGVGNIPELLDYDERFIAPSKDPEGLAEGVLYVHDHPEEMKEISKRNKERVYRFYDREQLHDRYRRIYQEYAQNGRNRV